MFSWDLDSCTPKMFRTFILLGIFFGCLPSTSLPLPLEAAFQGRCEEGNPCDQICFNLHDDMYECDCRPPLYILHSNGYNCMPSRNNETLRALSSSQLIANNNKNNNNNNNNINNEGINIQIEVDIEPPVDEADNLSSAELERLGLPSHHIHYRAGSSGLSVQPGVVAAGLTADGRNSGGLSAQPEVLAPEDIKVSYTVKDEEVDEDTEEWDGRGNLIPVQHHVEHHQVDDQMHLDEPSDPYNVDPPRALPDTQPRPLPDTQPRPLPDTQSRPLPDTRPDSQHRPEEPVFPRKNANLLDEVLDEEYDLDFQINEHDEFENGGSHVPEQNSPTLSSEVDVEPVDQSPLTDWIFDVPAFCGLDCGQGKCHSEREGSAWLSRCLCPAGFYGRQCALTLDIKSVPQFTGLSHLALPILQNAYSDLHLSFQFKPTSDTGLLLLTGETDDMTGDYLALVIIDGYVELRLDCGTGPGVVRSNSKVILNQWNDLAVNRHDWGVWIQLNQGPREEGRSQGLFSRITFNQPVYIGGQGDIKNTKSFLGVESGFQGCVKNLSINLKKYDLNPSILGGDVVSGSDIGSCSMSGCWDSECGAGTCHPRGDGVSCDCPLGYGGDRCQDTQHVQIPKFTGGSHLRHHGLGDAALLFLELDVVFKPELDHGLILYNGDSPSTGFSLSGDFIALYLVDGFVEFAINQGNGVKIVRSAGKVYLDRWQRVTVSRMEDQVYLYLEGVQGTTTVEPAARENDGSIFQLTLSQFLWIGGVEDIMSMLPGSLAVSSQFHGCLQKIVVNGLSLDLVDSAISGINIDQCQHPCNQSPCSDTCVPVLDSYSCVCEHQGAHRPCGEEGNIDDSNPIPGFTGSSYLFFNNADLYQNLIGRTNSMNLRLRLRSGHGIILWIGEEHGVPPQHFLLLGVDQGYLQLWFDVGGGETMLQYNHTKVDDGRWHRIRATRMDQYASLMVDNGPVQTTSAPGDLVQLINAKPGLYLGGVSEENTWARARYNAGMTGCVAELSVGNLVNIDLLSTAERGNNIDTCFRP